jgi:IS5 family transposase
VQPKNTTFPTDAKLVNRAREKLVKLADRCGVKLRQSYKRVGKLALIMHQRYAHARQFKRANRALRKLKTYAGRVIRDIVRKIKDNPCLEPKFARLLALARRVLAQERGQRGPKVYSLHAPEVECIGKGKPHKPYEFGVKVSVATTLKRCKGGQFAIHAKALPGNPYDGHTLAKIIPSIEQLVGNQIERLHADAGYRGHNAPPDYKFRVYTSKQKRRITPQIKREMRRRAAVEPVIGHLKNEHRMDRNYLHHRSGDANNAILAAIGYNFSLLLRWLRLLLRLILAALCAALPHISHPRPPESAFFTVDSLAARVRGCGGDHRPPAAHRPIRVIDHSSANCWPRSSWALVILEATASRSLKKYSRLFGGP